MNGHCINKKNEESSSENLSFLINKLYVDCLGQNVGQDFLELMDLNSLQEHFHKIYRYSESAAKLKNSSRSQHSKLVGDMKVYASRLQKIQDVSNSMIREIVLAYRKLLEKNRSCKPFPAKVAENLQLVVPTKPEASNKDNDVLETVPESNPKLEKSDITVTTVPKVLESLADYEFKFEDLFRNASPDDFSELRNWFNFDSQLNPKVYAKLFSDPKEKAPPGFKEELDALFTDLDWTNYNDKLKQFDLIDLTKLGEQLEFLMDYIHKRMINKAMDKESFALFETLLNEYFELIILNNMDNDTGFIQFKHLFSFKIRSMFFDCSSLNIDNGLERLNNARWITILCKSRKFDPNIILICLKYLVRQNDRFNLECFCYMINCFGYDSMKQLDQPKNSIEKKFIDSIFDCLSNKIAAGLKVPTKILDTLKAINKLRANNWSN